ncbi:MAG: tRNA (5-methylaminomethyl-2-thiouridine)(34)-methyltransferase MnmD [Proteobacteria bacterium]|jgi:tRNA 5-methylaminomethyl-2-thiouridine biosynthesis bifunctional protein|nr:tRNA (5-methylaminomethyl-2-thiouridine)(34)-methyltransferase MnmD [Pseudomonadota bacterium]
MTCVTNDKIIMWQNGNSPYSLLYDDIYYSPDGLAESTAVFLDGVGAPDIWRDKDHFTIGEQGFGTGLNFLNTAKLWIETASDHQELTYFACELHPLASCDIDKAIIWPDLKPYKDQLLAQYPETKISLYNGRITLLLYFCNSLEMLQKLGMKADAWYLDGFAPSKNPAMWTDEIFQHLARLSNDGAALATFTAAGHVRRGLSNAGFTMSKRKGFGNKREMLFGTHSN